MISGRSSEFHTSDGRDSGAPGDAAFRVFQGQEPWLRRREAFGRTVQEFSGGRSNQGQNNPISQACLRDRGGQMALFGAGVRPT